MHIDRPPKILVALLLLVGCVGQASNAAAQRGITKEQYITALDRALDQIAERAASRAPVKVAANLFFAHEALIERMPVDVLTKVVDAFADAGIYRVDLNIGLYPWVDGNKDTIAKYDAVVQRIRAKGMLLAFNPQYSPVKHKVGSLDEWRRAAIPVFADVADRYKPDIFVVAHEPTTMNSRMGGGKAKASDWADFARDAARAVTAKSPKTRIGAGGLYQEEDYFNAFVDVPEIKVLTLDIYRLVGLKQYTAMVKRAHDRGKAVYIEETWRPPYYQGGGGLSLDQVAARSVGDSSFQALDVKWMNTMADYAGAVGMEAITPVWMQTFFAYVDKDAGVFDPDYNRAVVQAIMRGERTKTYEALRALAQKSR